MGNYAKGVLKRPERDGWLTGLQGLRAKKTPQKKSTEKRSSAGRKISTVREWYARKEVRAKGGKKSAEKTHQIA